MTTGKAFTYFEPPGYPTPVGIYSYGTKVKSGASFIFVSGLAPLDDEGKGLVGFDIYTQTIRVMERMREVLKAAGATLGDVVKMRISLTDIRNRERYGDAMSTCLEKAPAIVLEVVTSFILPGQLIQIDAIAAI